MHILIVLISLLTLSLAQAGQPHGKGPDDKGKVEKLATPTNIACTTAGDELTVTWTPVEGATLYRIMLEAGTDDDAMETVPAPPYTQAVSDLTDNTGEPITVKVRAMKTAKGGKGASKPSAAMPCAGPGPAQLPAR